MKLKYYTSLDGLRGIAAIMVVIYHIFYYPNLNYISNLGAIQKVTEFGRHGVPLFFVLSGFVITRILIYTRDDTNYFRSFYKKRILRILPLYYLFLLIYYSLAPLLSTGGKGVELIQQVPFYVYLQNFAEVLNIKASGPGHYWTLSIEEQFYILWPLAVYSVNPKNLWKLIGILVISVFILRYLMLREGLPIDKFTFTRIDQILMGAFIAVLEWSGYLRKDKSLLKMELIGLFVLPATIFVYLYTNKFPLLIGIISQSIVGLLFFSIIGCVLLLNDNHFLTKFLTWNVLQYFGKISYGIYVWHVLIIMILNKFFITRIFLIDFILPLVITIIVAHLSYNYFENIFLKMKDKKINFLRLKGLTALKESTLGNKGNLNS